VATAWGREGGAPSFRFLALLRRVGMKSANGWEFNEIGGPSDDVLLQYRNVPELGKLQQKEM
jgi:hypothetical protein